MVEGLQVDIETALRIESRHLSKLMTGTQAKAMINTFFFNLNAIKSGQSRPAGVPRFKPTKVGLLGAGMMGAGIAYSQASKGIASVLKDVSQEKAELGKSYSAKITQGRVDKGRMTADAQQKILGLIQPTASAADLQGCDLIIEAVFENRELKPRSRRKPSPCSRRGGFFASNTSTLPITGLAKASRDGKKFIGIHFFSPVDKMKLVEIIRGAETDDETVARPTTTSRHWASSPSWSTTRAASSPAVCSAPSSWKAQPCWAKAFPPPPLRTPVCKPACPWARWRCWTKPRSRCPCT